jgi:uncharacterized protein YjbI with pentapeptide repeats
MPDLERADLGGMSLADANLNSANLISSELHEAELKQANLAGADLFRANLLQANLAGANLFKAKLICTHLEFANLTEVCLDGADLSMANLTGANLTRADLSRASFFETVLGNVDLTGAKGLDECNHYGPSIVDFRTLSRSKDLAISFLRGCGLTDYLIDNLPSLSSGIIFYSCFISYSSKDEPFVEKLKADLRDKGVPCWYAPDDLPVGSEISDAIDGKVRLF